MGSMITKATRHLKRFNVENRAHRVLEQEKPTPAPKFDYNVNDIRRALELEPDLIKKLSDKDASLDERLKNVYVTSKDNFIDHDIRRGKRDPQRPLPLDRKTPEDFEYGYKEPKHIVPGRCTLRQAITFITNHQEEPDLWTKEHIAGEYNLKPEVVEHILEHFKTFNVYLPDIQPKQTLLKQTKSKLLNAKKDKEST